MSRFYLDSASTTPIDSAVLESMMPFLSEHFGNASSIHFFGQQTKYALEEAREDLASELGAKPSEVFFTSSGTEADNLALKGVALALIGKRNHILSSSLEHKAVLESLDWLQRKFKFETEFIKHDSSGRLDLQDLKAKLRPNETAIVSVMHANNEIGNINPIAEIAQIARESGALFHTDAVQSAGKIRVNVGELGADLVAISGHKFYAPKGVGALYIKTGTPIESLLHGGSHERNRRASTENVAFCIGLSKALELANSSLEASYAHAAAARKNFLDALSQSNIPFSINGDRENGLPHIINLSFAIPQKHKLATDVLLLGLDAVGVAVSNGSACTSGAAKPSHVLLALGKSEHEARASVRVSISKFMNLADVEQAAERFATVVKRLL